MPRVLRIINRFNLGGPTYNAAYLTKYLEPDFETLLVGGEKDESEDSSKHIVDNLELEVITIPEMRRAIDFKKDRIAYKKLKNLIEDFKPDIVHTHAAKSGTLGRLAAVACGVPVVIHTFHGHVFHSYFGKTKTNIYKVIERFLAKKSTKIITLSEQQRHEIGDIHKICSNDKIEIVPLGFDLDRFNENISEKRIKFRKEYLLDDDEIAIGIIGRLVPIKNHKLFIDALNVLLHKTNKKVRAFIVGDGEERDNIESIIKELGIDFCDFNNDKRKVPVTFTSWIKNIDYVNSGLDIIALSSLNEGTPVSLIEAQASNRPIVSTKVGGVEDIVIPNKTAFLSESNDVEKFAENLLTLVENDDLRKEMGSLGWEHVKNKYHYKTLCENIRRLYYNLLS